MKAKPMICTLKVAMLSLAASLAAVTSTNAQGKSLADSPLPSYYAGQTTIIQIAERKATELRQSPHATRPHYRQAAVGAEQVYDGLPIERRFERRNSTSPSPRGSWSSRDSLTQATEKKPDESIVQRDDDEGDDDAGDDDAGDDDAGDDDAGDDDEGDDDEGDDDEGDDDEGDDDEGDDDEGDDDEGDEHIEAIDRVLESSVVRKILSLIEQNYELKAQLKIQEVEFASRLRIEATEREQQVSQRRIRQLEELHAERNHGQRRLAEQLERSDRELVDLRATNQQLEQTYRRAREDHEQAIQNAHRNLEEARQSKIELEHRVRALESQLETARQAK